MQKRMTTAIPSTETPFLDFARRRQHCLKLMMAPISVFPIRHHQPLLLGSVFTLRPCNISGPKQKAQATVCSQKRAVRYMELICPASHMGSKAKTNPAYSQLRALHFPASHTAHWGCTGIADPDWTLCNPKPLHLQATTARLWQEVSEASPSFPCWLPTPPDCRALHN